MIMMIKTKMTAKAFVLHIPLQQGVAETSVARSQESS